MELVDLGLGALGLHRGCLFDIGFLEETPERKGKRGGALGLVKSEITVLFTVIGKDYWQGSPVTAGMRMDVTCGRTMTWPSQTTTNLPFAVDQGTASCCQSLW